MWHEFDVKLMIMTLNEAEEVVFKPSGWNGKVMLNLLDVKRYTASKIDGSETNIVLIDLEDGSQTIVYNSYAEVKKIMKPIQDRDNKAFQLSLNANS
jgi:hypothetical protein